MIFPQYTSVLALEPIYGPYSFRPLVWKNWVGIVGSYGVNADTGAFGVSVYWYDLNRSLMVPENEWHKLESLTLTEL